MSTGQLRSYPVQAVDLARPIKVTLVWADAPALATAGAALQNQLYLQVQAPDGGVTNGDVHPIDQMKNNVQQVAIAAPVAGTYTIRVRGVSVTTGARGGPGRHPPAGLRPRGLQRRRRERPARRRRAGRRGDQVGGALRLGARRNAGGRTWAARLRRHSAPWLRDLLLVVPACRAWRRSGRAGCWGGAQLPAGHARGRRAGGVRTAGTSSSSPSRTTLSLLLTAVSTTASSQALAVAAKACSDLACRVRQELRPHIAAGHARW